jgi:hypothetical protein
MYTAELIYFKDNQYFFLRNKNIFKISFDILSIYNIHLVLKILVIFEEVSKNFFSIMTHFIFTFSKLFLFKKYFNG